MDQRGPISHESSTFSLCMGGVEFCWGSLARGKLVPMFPCFVMFQCLLYQPGKHFCPQWEFPFPNEWINGHQRNTHCCGPHRAPILVWLNQKQTKLVAFKSALATSSFNSAPLIMLQKKRGGYVLSKFIPVVDKHPNTAQWSQTVPPPAIKMHPRNSTGQLRAYPNIRSPICMQY